MILLLRKLTNRAAIVAALGLTITESAVFAQGVADRSQVTTERAVEDSASPVSEFDALSSAKQESGQPSRFDDVRRELPPVVVPQRRVGGRLNTRLETRIPNRIAPHNPGYFTPLGEGKAEKLNTTMGGTQPEG